MQGFDWVFNYKTQDIGQTLNIAAPNGVRKYYSFKDHLHWTLPLAEKQAEGKEAVNTNILIRKA